MRTVPTAWVTVETARERQVALLIHIYAKRDGRVTLPDGWGSWAYSVGFQQDVDFTDMADYAGEGTLQTRTYVPAAIEFDASQVFRQESTSLDPHNITLIVDPQLEPFADYVNRQWPLTFGIVIYKVYRASGAVQTVDDGHGNQIPVVDVAFIGYLDADDTLDTNSAGLEQTIDDGKLKLETKWDHITKVFDRLVPRPVFSIDCPKALFSTGDAAIACNADKNYVRIDGVITAANGVLVSAAEWGAQDNGWFAQGLLEFTATDPISGLEFGFSFNIIASEKRVSDGVTYGDITLEMFPPISPVGALASAYGGCDRTRATCVTKHIPAGSLPPPSGSIPSTTLQISLQLLNTTTNAKSAIITITPTAVSIVYFRDDHNQIGNILIGATSWDPTWASNTSSSIVTDPAFALAAGAGTPALPGYTAVLTNNGNGNPQIKQQPTANNGYALVVKINGQGAYDFTLSWVANAGAPVNLGNLENFGGTDIPVEHPSMETTS